MRVEHEVAEPGAIPTAEELAGRELRRLRAELGWSQEEVARRMAAFGYDWHQTTVGRIEAAQRPLRLNEAVSLAALFDVPLTQLLVSPTMGIDDIDGEIEQTEEKLAASLEQLEVERARLDEVNARMADVRGDYDKVAREIGWAQSHLQVLYRLRDMIRGEPAGSTWRERRDPRPWHSWAAEEGSGGSSAAGDPAPRSRPRRGSGK